MDRILASILNSNPEKNIATIGFFNNYPVEEYFIEGNSALVLGKSDHLWAHVVISSADELLFILARHHTKTKYYYSVEDWMVPLILKHGDLDWIMTTDRYVLEKNTHIPPPGSEIIEIDRSHAQLIYENSNYKDFTSIEYVEERLSNNISVGIIDDGKLVAWGFTHDDGALGFLHVLEEFRNKGYGSDILLGLIQKRRKRNQPVFGNIVPDNIASVKLVTKLGFKLDCKASWIKLK